MSDDLDNLIRAAMKTLDEQVPSGYFEALPNQTLARLEGSSMQHGPGTTGVSDNVVPPPMEMDTSPVPKQAERDEDSGLHDIRNLAQSTKQRLSKRGTQNPPIKDEDALASSSGSWKNIALPQPAKMVSLPEITELPSKKEVLAAEKAAKKAAKSTAVMQDDASVSLAAVAATDSPLAPSPSTSTSLPERAAFSLPSMQNKRSKAPLFAILGVGVAAAAGGVIYMQMNKSESAKTAPSVATLDTRDQAATGKAAEQPAPAAVAAPQERQKTDEELKAEAALEAAKAAAARAEADAAAVGAAPSTTTGNDKKPVAKTSPKSKKQEVHKDEAKTETKTETVKPEPKDPTPPPKKTGEKGSGESEESFDALLKEAGVDDKKSDKPKLEKKSLTGDDFKTGMAAVAAKAQACYKGTQGTASVKLTITPSGAVSKVSVGGAFAGKPEAGCVEAAVKGAKFPPWDGGPMSFTYAYMLSD